MNEIKAVKVCVMHTYSGHAKMEQFIETVKQFPILWNTEAKDYHNLNKKDVAWNRIVEEINNPDISDVKTAKNEWKKLRDNHRDSLKRMKAGTSGQTASPPKNNWKYAEFLEFLLPYMKYRKRTGNVSVSYQNTLPNSSTASQSILPCTSTQNSRILEETQQYESAQNDDSNLSSEVRRKRRKVADDSSLRDIFQEVDGAFMAFFMQRCEQRDKRKAEKAEEAKKYRHPLNLFFDSMCESTKKLPDWIQRDVKKKLFQIVCEAEETYEPYMSTQPYHGYTSSSAYSSPKRT